MSPSSKSSKARSKVKGKAAEYQAFVEDLSSKESRFQPLSAFLSFASSTKAKIHLVAFQNNAPPEFPDVTEDDLEARLQKNIDHELYIIEDLSPKALRILGGYCKVDA